MSVIGRLDKQVEEVLISPLDSNRRSTSATPGARTDENVQASEPALTDSGKHQNIRGQSEKEELPVWLL